MTGPKYYKSPLWQKLSMSEFAGMSSQDRKQFRTQAALAFWDHIQGLECGGRFDSEGEYFCAYGYPWDCDICPAGWIMYYTTKNKDSDNDP